MIRSRSILLAVAASALLASAAFAQTDAGMPNAVRGRPMSPLTVSSAAMSAPSKTTMITTGKSARKSHGNRNQNTKTKRIAKMPKARRPAKSAAPMTSGAMSAGAMSPDAMSKPH